MAREIKRLEYKNSTKINKEILNYKIVSVVRF